MAYWGLPFPKKSETGHFGKIRVINGKKTNPHRGTDYGVKSGTSIPAVTTGKIELIQWSNVIGWVVVQSDESGKYFVGYCHVNCFKHGDKCKGPSQHTDGSHCLKKGRVGDPKKIGQTIAKVGSTGGMSTGPHLHITLSKTVKGVFSGTVYDIVAFINKSLKKNGLAENMTALEVAAHLEKNGK